MALVCGLYMDVKRPFNRASLNDMVLSTSETISPEETKHTYYIRVCTWNTAANMRVYIHAHDTLLYYIILYYSASIHTPNTDLQVV